MMETKVSFYNNVLIEYYKEKGFDKTNNYKTYSELRLKQCPSHL